MPIASPDEVRALLDARREGELIGEAERSWLDFKLSPYVLSDLRQQWELAKDVAAQASNPEGGCLVLGVETRQDPQDFEDRAFRINRFPGDLINDQQYRDVIDASVYPLIRGLVIRRYDDNGCLGLIQVPPQDPDDQPFLLKRIV